MKKYLQIRQRLKEEEHRVNECLHPTTLETLKPMLNKIFIENYLQTIYEESSLMLRNENIEGEFFFGTFVFSFRCRLVISRID